MLWKNADDLERLEQSKPQGMLHGRVTVEKKTAGGSEAPAWGGEKNQPGWGQETTRVSVPSLHNFTASQPRLVAW